MSAYQTILFEVSDAVARITLNRPTVANALNGQMSRDLFDVSNRCDEDPGIRAVVLTGAGSLFCGGGDLQEFDGSDDLASTIKRTVSYLHGAISRFARMDAPIIGAINGTAGGAGMSFVCMCDMAIAAESAKFTMAYTGGGLTPDGSSTYYLPRLIGLRRALDLTLTNRRLTATEALEWGLINQICPDDQVLDKATQLATRLAAGPTLAYGTSKRLLRLSMTESLETQMENEARAIANSTRTEDAKEGIAAFLEKRAPQFKGK